MNDAADLHGRAMDLAEQATLASVRRDASAAELFRSAFELERQAAEFLRDDLDLEPTRAVLFRSAASLALDCGETREAERLIAIALSGDPPEEIAEELRDLLERAQFERHLELKGVTLEPGEFQLSLAGRGIGYGIAPSDAVVERIEYAEKLLIRTAERRAGKKFREGGSARRGIREGVELFVSVPRAASFAVTFRVGRPKEQIELPDIIGTTEIVDEMFTLLSLYEEGAEEQIREVIPDEAYFNNFVALAKQLGPDGEDVTFVGFTAEHHGERRMLGLTRSPRSPRLPGVPRPVRPRELAVTGRLLFADERHGANIIRLVDENEVEYKISVPPGMMSDIVRPLWESRVTVVGQRRHSTIHLQEIRRADDE